MKRDRTDSNGIEPHVFDQTNGVVDRGADEPHPGGTRRRPDDRTITGIAMLSTQRP